MTVKILEPGISSYIHQGRIDPKEGCPGLFFRGYNRTFITSTGGVTQRVELRFLKRRSCRGCEHCGYLAEMLGEEVAGMDIHDIQEGKIYQLVVDGSRPDDWWVDFKEIDA